MAVLLCIFFFLNFFFLMDYKIIVNIFKVAYGFYIHTKIYSNSTKFSKQKELNESFYSSNQNQKKKTKKIQWIIRFIDVFPCIPTIQFLLFSFLFVGTIDFNDLISYKKKQLINLFISNNENTQLFEYIENIHDQKRLFDP